MALTNSARFVCRAAMLDALARLFKSGLLHLLPALDGRLRSVSLFDVMAGVFQFLACRVFDVLKKRENLS